MEDPNLVYDEEAFYLGGYAFTPRQSEVYVTVEDVNEGDEQDGYEEEPSGGYEAEPSA